MKCKKIELEKIPLGTKVERRWDIEKVDLDFYKGGDYIYCEKQKSYYLIIDDLAVGFEIKCMRCGSYDLNIDFEKDIMYCNDCDNEIGILDYGRSKDE